MAKQNTDKILIGHAINTNSLLSKIEYIAAETKESMTRIEEISKTSLSVTSGLAASIAENTAVLKDIKDVLMKKTVDEGAKLKTGITIEKMLGLGGLIAVVGFGVFTLSQAFQATRGVSVKDIAMGTLIMAGLVPMMKAIEPLLNGESGDGLFRSTQKLLIFTAGIMAMVTMVVATSHALAGMATPDGSKLLTFIAISAALYIQGQIFIQLINAWEFSGLMNKFLNANNTNEIMQAMVVMSLNTIIIAGALSMMPDVSPKTAASFVIASAAMIPLAGALFVVRFALPMLNKIGPKQVALLGATMAAMALALIPVGLAARALAAINVTDADVAKVEGLIKILIPIAALVGFMTAITNLGKEALVSMGGNKEEGASLLKKDNSRKRNQKMNLKGIGIFALKAVTYLAVGGLLAVAFAKAAPYLAQGISAMNGLDYTGLVKFIAVAGVAVLLFGVAIGMVVSMVKGKETSTPGLMNLTGSAKSKPAKMSTADIIFAGLVLPMIIGGIVIAALGFKLINAVGVPEVSGNLLAFIAVAGLGVLIFGTVLGVVSNLMKGKVSKGLFKGGRPAKMSYKDVLVSALIIPAIALGIVATALVFKALPAGLTDKNAPDPTWSLTAGLSILAFGVTFALVTRALSKARVGFKDIAKGTVAMVGIAVSIVAISYIFQALGNTRTAPPVDWALTVSLSLLAFGIGFAMITKALQDRKIGFKDIAKGAVAVVGVAAAIVALALAFSFLPGTYKTPPVEWSLKAGLSILAFGIGFAMITKALQKRKIGFKDIAKGAVAVVGVAAAIVATSLAFSFLPGIYKTPPAEWSLKAGLSILAFGITYALVTKALQSRRVGFKDIAKGGATMLAIAASIVGISFIFGMLGNTWNAPPPLWSLTAGLSILAFGITYALVTKALQSRRVGFKDIAKGGAAMLAIAASIVGISFIFGMLGNTWNAPPVEWTQTAGIALLAFGAPFAILTVLFAKFRVGYNDMFKGALATILVAVTISAVSWIFSFLEGTWSAPPIEWSKSSGIAILVFGVSFAVLTMLFDKMGIGYGGMLKGAIGMVVVALAIVGVAWIFTWMPDSFNSAPPMDWSMGVALALVLFTIPVLIIGLIATSGVGALGILLGVVGIIVIAAGILAVAWILSAMPDLGAISKNFTDALMTPINAIIDAFARIKNELGVENLLSLAVGVAALGVAWLVFVGATAGASVAGGVGKLIGGLLDGIAGLFGADTTSPLDILEKLAEIAPKLTELASPLMDISGAFLKFTALFSDGAVEKIGKLFNAVLVPMDVKTLAMLGVNSMSTYLDKLQATMRHVAESYGMIAIASKGMNVEAIRASTDMFNALAYLASVGKDNALAQLGDKLILAVQELASMIADFEGTVAEAGDTNNQASSNISNAASKLVDKLSGLVSSGIISKPAPATAAQAGGGGGNANTQEIDVSSIVRAIQELEDTLTAQGIKIKER